MDLRTDFTGFFQRVALLQVWKNFEEERGTPDDVKKVEVMMPIQGKRRYVDEETGQLVEGTSLIILLYPDTLTNHSPLPPLSDYDYIFADDERESNANAFKLLQAAHAWAAKSGAGAGSGFLAGDDDSDSDSDEEEEEGERRAPARGQATAKADAMDEDDKSSVASSQG